MSTKIIKINRGDTFEFNTIIPCKKDANTFYLLTSRDVLYFALMYPHQKFEDAIVIKGYTVEDQDVETGKILIRLTTNDTRCLEPGVYYYTAKLQRGGTLEVINDFDEPDEIRTIIERTKFIINE